MKHPHPFSCGCSDIQSGMGRMHGDVDAPPHWNMPWNRLTTYVHMPMMPYLKLFTKFAQVFQRKLSTNCLIFGCETSTKCDHSEGVTSMELILRFHLHHSKHPDGPISQVIHYQCLTLTFEAIGTCVYCS